MHRHHQSLMMLLAVAELSKKLEPPKPKTNKTGVEASEFAQLPLKERKRILEKKRGKQ